MIDINSKIDVFELTVRSKNVLKAEGIFTIKNLVQYTERDLIRLPNMGRKSLNEIKEHLAVHSLVLGSIFEEPEKIDLNINLRDWFAGIAMQAMLPTYNIPDVFDDTTQGKDDPSMTELIAIDAYIMAETMLKVREVK